MPRRSAACWPIHTSAPAPPTTVKGLPPPYPAVPLRWWRSATASSPRRRRASDLIVTGFGRRSFFSSLLLFSPLLVCVCLSRRAAGDDHPDVHSDAGPAAIGSWLEGNGFRFRVEAIRDCGQQPARDTRSASLHLLAVEIRIVAGQKDVFVSPRDVTLESGGVILQVENRVAPVGKSCGPQWTAQRLSPRRTLHGVLLFAVPPDFSASGRDPILAYRPTRWGGAGRLEVRVPGCLGHCAPPVAAKPRPETR